MEKVSIPLNEGELLSLFPHVLSLRIQPSHRRDSTQVDSWDCLAHEL